MGKSRELDQEVWTEQEIKAAQRTAAKQAAASDERSHQLAVELLKAPCDVCGSPDIKSMGRPNLGANARVAVAIHCNSCDREEVRLATRKGLDMWQIRNGVLLIVAPDGCDQIVNLRSACWAKLTHLPDASMVEVTDRTGQWATATVADGQQLFDAIRAQMEIQS